MKLQPYLFLLLLLPALACKTAFAVEPPELIDNGGFESGTNSWVLFVPDESLEKHCEFTISNDNPHSGAACGKLTSGDIARFAVGHKPVPVTAGDHYRVSAWYRGDSQTTYTPRTVGFAIRLTLSGGHHIQINAEGDVSPGNPATLKNPMPTTWTQVNVVIKIPPGVTTINGPELFSYAKGSLYVDDVSIQKVDSTVAVTPLHGGATYESLAAVGGAPGSPPPPPVLPAHPGPLTTDAEMIAELNLDAHGMEKVKAAVRGGRLPEIQAAYLDYRRHISTAKWTRMPADSQPKVTAQTVALADQIAHNSVSRGSYHYGPPVTFMGDDFNWQYNPVSPGDSAFSNEFTYCIVARTESWQVLADVYQTTHDEKYAQAWVKQLEDFAAKNPVDSTPWQGKATVWRTLDTGTRMNISWPYCYFRFLNSPSFTPEAQWIYARMMRDQANFLVGGLQDQSRTGNWVTDECAGLYTVGALFSEMNTAASWRETAVNRLLVEADRTFQPDGMESELTPGYHYGAVSQFQSPYDLAKLNNLPIPAIFKDKLLLMYQAPILVMDQNGSDVPTNDSWIVNARKSAKDGLRVADDPLLEWAVSNGHGGTQPPDSTMLPYAGFYAMRSGWGGWDQFVFFRAGPPGTGHDHQEKLEVVMNAWGTHLLIDPGTYAYDRSQWRRYFIGTASHNTIIVDGKWQHTPCNSAPFQPVNNPWVTTPLFDYVAGTYNDGYQQNQYAPIEYSPQKWVGEPDKSVSHTRRVLYLRPWYALVVDTLDGTGHHTFEAHWNIDDAGARVDSSSLAIISASPQTTTGADAHIALIPLERENLTADVIQGQQSPILGWKPVEGRPVAIPTGRFIKEQDAPAAFATLLYPFRHNDVPVVTGSPLSAGDGVWAQSLATPREKAEIALVKDGSTKPVAFQSALLGTSLQAGAAAVVIRQATGKSDAFVGGWGLQSYDDGRLAFRLDSPASLVFTRTVHPLFYNASDTPAVVTFTRPSMQKITLPSKTWSDETGHPANPPALLEPSRQSKLGN
jgi:hypothetical protein